MRVELTPGRYHAAAFTDRRLPLAAGHVATPRDRGSAARRPEVSGGPAGLAGLGDRGVEVLVVDVVDDRVQTIHLVANPAKLAGLAPVARTARVARAQAMSQPVGGAAS